MGRRNLPCSTVNAQTVNSIGARFVQQQQGFEQVSESLPPESATATRSPSRIILESRDGFADFAQQCFFEFQKLKYRADRCCGLRTPLRLLSARGSEEPNGTATVRERSASAFAHGRLA